MQIVDYFEAFNYYFGKYMHTYFPFDIKGCHSPLISSHKCQSKSWVQLASLLYNVNYVDCCGTSGNKYDLVYFCVDFGRIMSR